MFRRSQRFYDLIYGYKDYGAETERLGSLIDRFVPGARTLLDVACGTGKHLELLRDRFQAEGLDLDPGMLDIARQRLGDEIPLHLGDMTDFDLDREFDVVTCLFSAIGYMTTEENLRAAVANMARHTAPGGLVVIESWIAPDAWTPGTPHALLVDEPDLKIARLNVAPETEDVITLTFHYLVATSEGVESFTEDHTVGMFTHEQYVEAVTSAGLEVHHDEEGLSGRALYLGAKPG